MSKDSSREEKRKEALKAIRKKHGTGAVMTFADTDLQKDYPHFPTGFVGLDYRCFGIGGPPKGRIIEIYGDYSSGKTTLTLHLIAAIQAAGGSCAFIDVEHALDPRYAAKLGVNLDDLLISQPDSAEEAFDICNSLVESGAYDFVVMDSLAGLVPQAEREKGETGSSQVGGASRLISTSLRQLVSAIHKSSCTLCLLNQIRSKIGGMGYGPQTDTTGGNAPKFYASVRLELKKIKQLKGKDTSGLTKDDVVVGSRVKITSSKNKMFPPFKSVEYDLMAGKGFSKEGELFDMGIIFGFVDQAGKTFTLGDTKLGVGRSASVAFLQANTDVRDKLFNSIRDRLQAASSLATKASSSMDDETGEILDDE